MATSEEKANFFKEIKSLTEEKNIGYLEAIILYCDNIGLEQELAITLINPSLSYEIQKEAESLNLIKKSGGRLPV